MLELVARWCYRKRRLVLAGWIVAFVAIGVLAGVASGKYSTDYNTPGSDSKAAHDLLEERFPDRAGDTIPVVYRSPAGVNDPAVRQRVETLLAKLAQYEHVVGVESPYGPGGERQVSRDGTIAFATLQLDVQGSSLPVPQAKQMLAETARVSGNGMPVELGGQAIQNAEFEQGSSSEVIGILAAVLILLIAFGSVLAMGLPILTAVLGIGIGLSALSLLANVVAVPNFAPIVAAMIGIGVGIDYALFIVTRYRQGLHSGFDPERATVVAMTTAGRAVIFAGTTVVIAVMGMLLMNLPFLQGVAVGSAIAVLVAMACSITLLTAMFGFVGRNIDKWRVPFVKPEGDHRTGFWFRWSRLIQRRPWPGFLAGLTVLVLLAIPVLSMRLGFPGEETQSTDRSSRRAYDLFVEGFGPGFSAPLVLAAELPGPKGVGVIQELAARLRSEPGVAAVTPPHPNRTGDAAVITVFPKTGGQSVETEELVRRLRGRVIPAQTAGTGVIVHVGGPNASFVDSGQEITDRLPIFIAVVVGLSFLLLMAVFRSILVALKAAVLNLLSIAAAYGVVVAVAQWGWGKDIFGISATAPIANFIPMMMFAILFGLSMDYEVFLLSRIREEWVRTGDNALAVADGLAQTARVITAAAAIMIMVFLAFVLVPELVIRQIGLGLAAAIFIDATIVRMVLVPSTMELLGKANWWLPGWLDKILPKAHFEGAAEEVDLDREMAALTAEESEREGS